MIKTKRLAYATLETPDLERQIDYYVHIFGLALAGREKGRAFLSTPLGQQAVVLESGAQARCTKVAFEADPAEDLAAIAKALAGNGITAARKSNLAPAVAELLSFADPKGTEIEIFTASTPAAIDPAPQGFGVIKLGHIAFNVADIRKVAAFYCDVLGFRVSDWRSDFFVFLRCGPDHHTVNFASHGAHEKMHHMAFEVKDWAEIGRACDFLGRNNYHLIWGPGRHIIGHNIFIYHRNPDGQIMELYCEMDQMKDEALGYFEPRPWHQDVPQKPKVWPADTLGSFWGGRAPPGFGD
jgi:catechol 2,3-dioxygenase-like lactoylglutathione lyase family enzyme